VDIAVLFGTTYIGNFYATHKVWLSVFSLLSPTAGTIFCGPCM